MKKLYLSCLLLVFCLTVVKSQTLVPDQLSTNVKVYAIVKNGNTVYIGGQFTSVGRGMPYAVPINKSSNDAVIYTAQPNGPVRAIIEDGSGGWYIGGEFTQVAGQPRNRLARINADGTLNPWNPDCNGMVNTIALLNSTVFVGGVFSNVNGQPRLNIACINTDGSLNSWTADANGQVNSIVANVTEIYVGGNFNMIAGQPKAYIACINASTGVPTAFDALCNGPVYTVVYRGATILIGGKFNSLAGWPCGNAAEINSVVGFPTLWRPNLNDTVYAIATDGTKAFLGGAFTQVGATTRNRIACINLNGLAPTTWGASGGANGTVRSLVLDGNNLYAGGSFTSMMSNTSARYFATLDATTAVVTPWKAEIDYKVHTISVSASIVYLGGYFTSAGLYQRNMLAAFDATTLQVLPFNAKIGSDPWGGVNALAISGNTLFIAGYFYAIGNNSRLMLGAVDATTGVDIGWNPSPHIFSGTPPICSALAVDGTTLYVGGGFESIAGTWREHIAAFDLSNFALKPFSVAIPTAGAGLISVNKIVIHNNLAYLAGVFYSVNGVPRTHFAVVDKITGALQPLDASQPFFDPKHDIVNNTLYIGGRFTTISGQPRTRLAAYDVTTQTLLPFNPGADNAINSILASGNDLYLGGNFTFIGGASRNRLARIDLTTGLASSWHGNANASVNAMLLDNNRLYVGGDFTTILGQPKTYFAILENSVGAPLPVNFISFAARPKQTSGNWQVDLNWSTASEQNSAHFIVERSKDGRSYNELGTVIAAGNSNSTVNYNFVDKDPIIGTAYYRLRQVDLDGKVNFSKIAIANINGQEIVLIAYPNPANDFLNLLVNSPVKQQVRYSVTDISGRIVKTGNYSLQKGDNNFALTLNDLSQGRYLLQLSNVNGRQLIHFVKQ